MLISYIIENHSSNIMNYYAGVLIEVIFIISVFNSSFNLSSSLSKTMHPVKAQISMDTGSNQIGKDISLLCIL